MSFGWRAVLTLAISLVATVVASKLLIPVLRRRKMEQHVRDDGPKSHLKKEGTPTMGGVMILIGIMCALLFSVYSDARTSGAALFMTLGTLIFAAIGFLDDFIKLIKKRSLGLRAWQKIVLQLGASFFVAWFAYSYMNEQTEIIPFVGNVWDLGIGYVPFTMFVFLAMVNSVNLTDGLDGLATSCSLINAAAFFAIVILIFPSILIGGGEVLAGKEGIAANAAVFSMAIVGACIGFLFFNRHPAKVFMGDTGSFALGAALTVVATTLGLELVLPIMGIMYVLSAVSVIIQVTSFKLRHKRVFKMAPLHHHFELMGIPETKVVGGYVIVTALMSAVSVVSVAFL